MIKPSSLSIARMYPNQYGSIPQQQTPIGFQLPANRQNVGQFPSCPSYPPTPAPSPSYHAHNGPNPGYPTTGNLLGYQQVTSQTPVFRHSHAPVSYSSTLSQFPSYPTVNTLPNPGNTSYSTTFTPIRVPGFPQTVPQQTYAPQSSGYQHSGQSTYPDPPSAPPYGR